LIFFWKIFTGRRLFFADREENHTYTEDQSPVSDEFIHLQQKKFFFQYIKICFLGVGMVLAKRRPLFTTFSKSQHFCIFGGF
jgi:hypothetical protein